MEVKRIRLKNFRNYEDLELSFDSSRNIIIGENAQGKTNLIEAIYLCAFARSFRTQNTQDMIMIGKDRGSVLVEAVSEEIEKEITVILDRSGKKMIKKDQKVIRRTAELLNNLVVVVFSPEDLRIIKDNPEKRRNFINKEISQLRPKYYECLRNYNEVLKQKNAVLKDSRGEDPSEMLEIYDLQLEKYGSEIVRFRQAFVTMLSAQADEIQQSITGGKEHLEIRYQCSLEEDQFYEGLRRSRERDLYTGHCGVGPHRDDLDFYINGRDARKYGSQGQQRTIALALKLAEIRIAQEILGESPILLLDDVLSELDLERQQFLFQEIRNVQLFITTTEVNQDIISKMPKGIVFKVSSGCVIKTV
ncbi:MAG: DNA replication/repair protein RecF [Mogibacterium sp.]|nr:DNA replication/repair protein RecF [Mogibacterium sp.]